MRKLLFLILGAALISGCTRYVVKKGESPYDKGYVVARRAFVIPEYTIGENNSVPDSVELAKERFARRKNTVEYYYKKMGDIDTNFHELVMKPLGAAGGLMTSPFRLPVVAYQDYKYEHNPEYKEKVDKLEEKTDTLRREKVKVIRDYLNKYIQDDLDYEKELMVAREKSGMATVKVPETQEEPGPAGSSVTVEETKPQEKAEVKQGEAANAVEEKPAVAEEAKPQEAKSEEAKVEENKAQAAKSEAAMTEEVKPEEAKVEEAAPERKPEVEKSEAKTQEVVQPQEAVKAEAESVQADDVEKKMAEELVSQEENKAEEKPAKVSMWQKMKNVFKHKEKPAKVQEEAPVEEKPKVSMWQKMKNAFKSKEKTVSASTRVPGEPPVAIIVAKPVKGYSPLKVHFSASRSRAVKGKILSYEWDFGDGDTSKKPSCVNTFYSGSFEPKKFTVTLTIQDDRGNVGTTSTEVEVLNK